MLGALLSIALEFGSTVSQGPEPYTPELRVVWDAPPGRCPGAAEVQRRLAARLPGHRLALVSARDPAGQAPAVRVVISGQPGAWRAELQLVGAASLRRLEDPSCGALSDALLLVVGLAFEAEANKNRPTNPPRVPAVSQVPEPGVGPSPPRSNPPIAGGNPGHRETSPGTVSARSNTQVAAPAKVEENATVGEDPEAVGPAKLGPKPRRRQSIRAPWRWHFQAEAALGLGVFKGAAWSVGGALGLGRGRLWGQLAGQFWLPDLVGSEDTFGARLTRWTTAARICFSPLRKAVELATCAAIEAGATQIRPEHPLIPRLSEPDAAHLAGLLGLRLLVPVAVSRRTRVETVLTLSTEVGYSALARPFTTEPSGTVVFPARPVFGVLAIGCLWRGGS